MNLSAKKPLVIQEQGSFFIGGSIVREEGVFDPWNPPDCFTLENPYLVPKEKRIAKPGQSLRGDHAYVAYQIPEHPRKLPIVMLHGGYQSGKCWETTPDGREGFRDIFLRRDFSVYVPDQPRRGRAGRATVDGFTTVCYEDETTFNTFRLGQWPNFYEGVQFSRDPEALNQFFRQVTPNTADYNADVISDTMSELFDKIGDGIMMTHSQSGGLGWLTAVKNPKVKAIVCFEPGSGFLFPEGEVPEPITTCMPWNVLPAVGVPMETFMKLTRIPIIIYYGDNIAMTSDKDYGKDHWRARYEMAQRWAEKVNSCGGHVDFVHLPEIGIYGNTHFPFSDLNSLDIAELVFNWLHEKGLD